MKEQLTLSVRVDSIEKNMDTLEAKVNSLEINGANFNGKWKWVEKEILTVIGIGVGFFLNSSHTLM